MSATSQRPKPHFDKISLLLSQTIGSLSYNWLFKTKPYHDHFVSNANGVVGEMFSVAETKESPDVILKYF